MVVYVGRTCLFILFCFRFLEAVPADPMAVANETDLEVAREEAQAGREA